MKSASTAEAKRLYNTTNESINALKVLNEPVEHWDSILLLMLEKKLDAETRVLWYREKKSEEEQSIQDFLNFLEKRLYELENTQKTTAVNTSRSGIGDKRNQARTLSTMLHTCVLCSKQHQLYQCKQFLDMEANARRNLVQRSNICFNCLQPDHRASNCKRSSCRKCGAKHNSLLHTTSAASDVQLSAVNTNVEPSIVSANITQQSQRSITLLPTAIVVRNRCNELNPCRALLDSGSQGTLITESCIQRLQLKRGFDRTMLYGIGSVNGSHTRGRVELHIEAIQYDTIIRTEALCLLNLTHTLPPCDITHQSLAFFNEVNLTDPSYSKPNKIDIILGADVFTSCLLPEKLTHPSGSPTAVNTIFGWVIMGKIKGADEQHIVTAHTCVDLSQQLQRFWEVKALREPMNYLTDEEKKAEIHFQQHTHRDEQGRYVVRLPLKEDEVKLGESQSAALKRLISVERQIDGDVQLKKEYGKFMDDYL
ncbi:uncharacterized protein LOC118748529 [Rhagoletis pomonella]|uniref:uncharacterized protein LOC118748529 n=1 Tax=Rhagoletis pomonella TaxID=28610 RepID=UPI00177B8B37|nr:uncharacterized protein LOC118748529 [Rhagoletis pomonella]